MSNYGYDNEAAVAAAPRLKGNGGLCTVNAYAVLSDEAFDVAAYMLSEAAHENGCGQPGKDMCAGEHIAMMKFLGLDLEMVPEWRWPGKTVRTFSRNSGSGKYLVYTSSYRHVVPIVDGEVRDWTEGRLHRVCGVWKVAA